MRRKTDTDSQQTLFWRLLTKLGMTYVPSYKMLETVCNNGGKSGTCCVGLAKVDWADVTCGYQIFSVALTASYGPRQMNTGHRFPSTI